MAKEIQVIFTEDKKGQFRMGQKKNVKLGYARNFLFPQNLAVLVTKENEVRIQSIEKRAEKHLAELKKLAEDIKTKVDGQTVKFKKKTHDEGKLYGSVTTTDIAEELNKAQGTELDKYDFKSQAPIKEVGEFDIALAIHPEVEIAVKVVVEAEAVKKKVSKAAQARASKREEDAAAEEENTEEVAEETTSEVESEAEPTAEVETETEVEAAAEEATEESTEEPTEEESVEEAPTEESTAEEVVAEVEAEKTEA